MFRARDGALSLWSRETGLLWVGERGSVEAKRRVLSRHVLSPATGDPELPWDNRDDCQYDGETWPCDDLLDLASPYADHPAY
ncbi:hypothetical protein EES41_39750 (plasmid) [Streptomyces sp. ADI95-16]|nr:hypothetical protein EES41_39750 [Streptomyces sp. ADI95-16]